MSKTKQGLGDNLGLQKRIDTWYILLESPDSQLSKDVAYMFIAICVSFLWAKQNIGLVNTEEYWIEYLAATVKSLNWEFGGHSQIIELKIWWPLWNYWIENFTATAKLLLNWEFHGHSQIIELRISRPLPNYYWIENFMATAKLLNWEFGGHCQIIELRILQPQPNYWIELECGCDSEFSLCVLSPRTCSDPCPSDLWDLIERLYSKNGNSKKGNFWKECFKDVLTPS